MVFKNTKEGATLFRARARSLSLSPLSEREREKLREEVSLLFYL
jgi:hypothetical protein